MTAWGESILAEVKAFVADLNSTSFKTVTTEFLWFITPPFLYLVGLFLPDSALNVIVPGWLAALCAKSGVDYVRYKADRQTAFRPQDQAEAEVLRAKADVIRATPTSSAATVAVTTPPTATE